FRRGRNRRGRPGSRCGCIPGTVRVTEHRQNGGSDLTVVGAIAQLVERFVRNEEARGSNPLSSTLCELRAPFSDPHDVAFLLLIFWNVAQPHDTIAYIFEMCQLELGVANRCVRLLSCEETRCCGVPVCDGCQNHAHLIDQVLLYKRPIDGATATDHQPLDTELVELAEHQLVIDLLLACDNV